MYGIKWEYIQLCNIWESFCNYFFKNRPVLSSPNIFPSLCLAVRGFDFDFEDVVRVSTHNSGRDRKIITFESFVNSNLKLPFHSLFHFQMSSFFACFVSLPLFPSKQDLVGARVSLLCHLLLLQHHLCPLSLNILIVGYYYSVTVTIPNWSSWCCLSSSTSSSGADDIKLYHWNNNHVLLI